MTRILILYATSHGHTRVVAQTIADRLRTHEARVQMANFDDAVLPSPGDFDVVVLGSRVHFNKLDRRLRSYVARHHAELTDKPSYLFSVGLAQPRTLGSDAMLEEWCKLRGWTPRATATFAGALLYRSYNPFMRLVMKLLSRRGGHPTDTSRDYIFTNWAAVAELADKIAAATAVVSVPVAS
jgi:menaquinone-dependent protoporphyrinogen oxidase